MRAFVSLLMVVTVLPVVLDGGLSGDVAEAQEIDSFTPPAFTINTSGAIDIIGNGLFTCGNSSPCRDTLAGENDRGNGDYTMTSLDADDGVLPATASGQTTRSSGATFVPPADSEVLYAALYWSGISNSAARDRVDFFTPGSTAYQTVTGTVDAIGSLYQGRADVTALVQAAGPGEYWAGDVQASTGRGRFAAWSMVIVYENSALPVRNLSVFEGFSRVRSSFRRLDVPVSGFLTPPFGDVNAEIGVVAYEGDRNIIGDSVSIDTVDSNGNNLVRLSDPLNPQTNFGNGSITAGGVANTSGTPGVINNLNVDIDEFATTNVLANGQQDTVVSFQTQGDAWYPGALTFQVDLFVPEFPEVTKTVVDLNGGQTEVGDVLEYNVTFENVGSDASIDSRIVDTIPTNTTYVAGSARIDGAPATAQIDFDGTELVARVGDGADATSGGRVVPGDSAEFTFRVEVDASAAGTDVDNTARFAYTAETLDEEFAQETNTVTRSVPQLVDLTVEKSGAPSPLTAGNDLVWTYVVSNAGPSIATGVTLTDTLPAGLTMSAHTGATCTGTDVVSCALADIAPGGSQTVTVTTPVDASTTDGTTYVNDVNVSSVEADANRSDNTDTADAVTVLTSADLSITKIANDDPIQAGGNVVYTVVVTNAGPSDAQNVRVQDNPDSEIIINSLMLPGATCDNGARSCVLPTLAAGTSATMTVDATIQSSTTRASAINRAQAFSDTTDPTPANNQVELTTNITQVADVTITKTTADAPVVAGEQVTYDIVASNAGPSVAQSVVVTDVLPAGLTFVSASPRIGSCSGTATVSCDLGALAAGASVPITVTATVAADAIAGSTLTNTATISTTTPENPGNTTNTASVSDTIANAADLEMTKEVSENPLVAGTTFDYTLTATNLGPSDSTGTISIVDTLPANIVAGTLPAGCSADGQTITCESTDSLAVGADLVFVIPASVPPAAAVPTVQNTATVNSANDSNASNDTAVAETTLVAEADVTIDKQWAASTVTAGVDATFTLTVDNTGPSLAQNVVVTDVLPAGATLVSAAGATCTGTTTVSCALGDLAVASSTTITVVVAVPAGTGPGALSNTATVTSDTDDRNPSNNTSTDVTTVERLADVSVTKVSSTPTPVAGVPFDYVVEVFNAGPSTALGSFVGDALPAGLTFSGAPPAGCTESSGVLSCDLGELAVDPTNPVATVTYTVIADPSLDPTTLTNNVSVSSPTPFVGPATAAEDVAVGAEADLAVTKTASLDPATPGGPLTYTITVDNVAGPSDATDVVITDTAPVGFTVTSVTSSVGTCTTAVECTIGRIPVGDTVTITVVGSVDNGVTAATLTNTTDGLTSSTTLLDPSNDTATATIELAPRADLIVNKTADVDAVNAGGGSITYNVSVSNIGPSDAADVIVSDVLPADFTVVSVVPSQGTCASATSFPCDLGAIVANGPVASVVVTGFYASDVATGTRTNAASATSSTPLDNTGDDAASVDVEVTAAADIQVTKAGPAEVRAGRDVTWTISVLNDGPSTASLATLTDVLDATLLDAVNATATTTRGTCTNNAGTIDCDLGDMAVGTLATVTITAAVDSDAAGGVGALTNTATGSSATPDPVAANDASTLATDISINSDLVVTKTGPGQFVAGESADYTIEIENLGPSDAVDVVLSDTPAGIATFGAVTSSPAGCAALPCTIGSIPAGQTVTVTVAATIDENVNNTSVSNTASVTSTSPDRNLANNSGDTIDGVVRRADVEVESKTASPDPVIAGETLTYEILSRNNGPSTARAAVLTDTLPAGVTLVAGSLPAGCTNAAGTITCELGDLANGDQVTTSFDVIVDADATGTIDNTATIASDTTQPDGPPDPTLNDTQTASTTIGGEADYGITKTASPDPAVPGQPLTYTVVVTNAGPSTARDVVVADDITGIFDGAVNVTTPAGVTCDLTVACDPFDLPIGSATVTIAGIAAAANTVDIDNTATVAASTPEPAGATLPNSATIATPVAPSADLVTTKVADVTSPATVDPTDTLTYTVTVTNNGPSNALDVSIVDTPPAELTVTSVTSDDAAAICDLGTATCSGIDLANGATVTMTVTGTVGDRAVGSITNSATATSAVTPDPSPANNTGATTTGVTPVADVGVTKTLLTTPLVAGQPARYELVVTNNGPADAVGVDVIDTLPAGVTFTAISSPIGTCTPGAAQVTTVSCDLGTLGDQASVRILVDVSVDADTDANLVNTATVDTDTQEPAGGNPNSATTDDAVDTQPDLRVRKELVPGNADQPDLVAGDTFEYRITVFNDGPSDALNDIVVTDPLPSQIDGNAPVVVTNTIDDSKCAFVAPNVTCTFDDDLAVGESIVITVTGTIDPAATTVDDNTATVTTTDNDPDLVNNTSTATATLIQNADVVATKSFDNATVVAGETTTFTMSVTNNGPSVATNARLTDTLPAGMTLVSATSDVGSCNDAQPLVCTVGLLGVDDTMSVDVVVAVDAARSAGPLNNSAIADSDTDDRNPGNDTAVDGIQVERAAALSITKSAATASVVAGNTIEYTVVVSNAGPSTAEASVLGDPLDPALTIITPLPAGCTAAGGILDCELGTLAAGGSASVVYSVTVDPSVPLATVIGNTASASSITPPPAGTPPAEATEDITISTSADVELVSKTVSPDPAIAGTAVTYTLVARNNGPSIARDTTIVDDLPGSLTPVSGTLPAGCSDDGFDVTCALGTLQVGEERTITFDALVASTTADASIIVNSASISSEEADPDSLNNDASASTTVGVAADISIAKVATPDPAVPGSPISYTVTVTNNGPSVARDVVVDDAVPAELTGVAATASNGDTCTPAVSCDLGELVVGETVTITVDATVIATTTAPISNTATVTSSTPNTATGGLRTATIDTPVAPITDLAIAKTLAPLPPVPGQPVQYTITVTNPGPSAAQNVVVTDTLDAAVTNIATATAGCSVTDQDLSCVFATLAPGSQTIVVSGDLAEGFTGDLTNTAGVTTDTDQGANPSPDTATVTETAAPDADLRLDKAASPDPIVAGEELTYTITVTNDGPSTAVGVVVDDVLPAGFDPDDVTSSAGGCVELPCELGTLVNGQTETVTVIGTVGADVVDLPPNSATVTSDTDDSNTLNDTAVADPVVGTSASVATTKVLAVPADGVAVPGQSVTWVITVANDGPSDALDVQVADTVPGEVVDVVVSSSQGDCTTFPCDLGTIATAGSATITVTGDLPADVPAGNLVNSAATTSSTDDPDGTDNKSTATNVIAPSADLTIAKAGPVGDVTPGTEVTYTIIVTNDGPSDATSIVIDDTLPAAFDAATVTEVSPGADCTITGSNVNCTQTVLEDGQSTVVTLTGTIVDGFTGLDVANTATVTSATPDPDPVSNSSTATNASVAEADLAITKTLTTAPPVPGEPISYEIVVTNPGPSVAQAVVVTDSVPAAVLNPASLTPGCSFVGQDLTCTLGGVAPGSSTIIVTGDLDEAFTGDLVNTASVATTTDQGDDTSPNSATSTESSTPNADLAIVKTATPDPVTAGETVTYELTVTNAGPSTATSVNVSDTLPAGFTLASVTSTQGDCTAVPCDLGTLPDQGSATITIVGTIDADQTDVDANLAAVTSATPDANTADNTATADPAIDTRAELSITKVGTPTVFVPGQPVKYDITVTNTGPSDALNTVVSDTVPAELDNVTISSSIGNCTTLPCTLGTVAAGVTETITISADLPADVDAATISNTATVSADTADTDPLDDTATATNTVTAEADLQTSKVGPALPAVPGETVSYFISVVNNGPSTALGVEILDTLDPAFDPATVVATSVSGAACTNTGLAVSCTQASLDSGTNTIVQIDATLLASFTGASIDNTATATSTTPDSTPGNDTSTVTTPVEASADISITKIDDVATTLDPGGVVTYTIRVDNAGPSDAQGVDVVDVLPTDITPQAGGITSSQGACTALPCPLGVIPAGGFATVTVVADVSDRALDEIVNTATASTTTNDPTPNNEATVTTSVTPFADLGVVKALVAPAAPDVLTAGVPARYELTVTNAGPAIAVGTSLVDTLPAGTTLVSTSTPVGSCDDAPAGVLTCDLGDLPDGASVTIVVNVDVAPDQTADLVNDVSVESPTVIDPVAGNDTAQTTSPTTIEADLQVAKALQNAPIVAGAPFAYDIVITNNGRSTAIEDIVFTDTLPTQVDPVTLVLPAGCSADGLVVTCTFSDDLASNDTIEFTISGSTLSNVSNIDPNNAAVTTVDDPAVTQVDPDPANNTAAATGAVTTEADLQVDKSFADDTTIAGDGTIEYTLTVVNDGPSDADNVIVTDELPAGLTVSGVPIITGGGTTDCAVTTPNAPRETLTCTGSRIVDQATMTIVVTAIVDPNQPAGPLSNTASAISDETDRSPSNNVSTDSINVTREAELAVAKVADPPSQLAGNSVDYTVTVSNAGPSTAEATVLGDALPEGMVIDEASIVISANAPAGATCAAPGGILTCDLGLLPAGSGNITVDYTVDIDPDVVVTNLSNSAQVSSSTPPSGGTPTPPSTADVTIGTEADLQLVSKTATPGTVVAGTNTSYTVVARNNGPSVSRDVQVVDTLPAGLVVVAQPAGCTYDAGANTLSCSVGDLGVTEEVSLTYEVTVDEGVTAPTLTNSVAVSSPTTVEPAADPNPNTLTEDITIATEADLGIVKSATPLTVVPGENLTYELVVTNAGPSTARDVVVTDDLAGIFEPGTVTVTAGGGASCTDAFVCDPFDLPVGSVTFAISGEALRTNTDPIDNTAAVAAATDEPADATLDGSSTVQTPVAPTADVSIDKSIVTDPVVPGAPVSFSIVVTNPGPSAAQAVEVTDTFAAAFSNIVVDGVDGADAADCTVTGRELVCDFGVVDEGTITITVTADLAEAATGAVTNTAAVATTTDQGLDVAPNTSTATEVAVPTADVAVSKVATPVVAGEDVTYTIVVDNLIGPSTATGVTVADVLPADLTLVSVSSSQGGCTALPCVLGDIAFGADATVTVIATVDSAVTSVGPNSVSVTTSSTDPDTGAGSNNVATATPDVGTRSLLTTTKTLANTPAVPGEPVEWTITVANAGPSDARSVAVADTLPAQVTGATFVPSQGSCDAGACDLETIAAGGSATIVVTAELPADVPPGNLVNSVSTTSDTPADPASTLQATSTEPIEASADVQILKAASPAPFVPGQPGTYTLTVTNDGPSDSQGIVFDDRLPAALDLTSVTIDSGTATCSPTPLTDRDVTCTQATLAAGATTTVVITGDVLPDVTDAVANAVTLTTTTTDPTPGNDNSSTTTAVAPVSDIGLGKVITTPVVSGSVVSFEITVTNNGPSTAENVVVVDALPAEFTGVTSSTPGCVVVANEVTCTLGSVDPGFTSINVSGRLDSGFVGAISNTADLTTTTPQTGTLPDTATIAGSALTEADLSIGKTAQPDPVVAGQQVTYTITATNNGPSDSLDVLIADTLPAGLVSPVVTASQGGCTDTDCDVGTIAAGATATVTIVATVDPSFTTLGANSASVSSPTTTDPTPGNDTATATPALETRADLATTKVLNQAVAIPGEPLSWLITVANPGPSDAVDVVVADSVPASVTNVRIIPSQNGCLGFPCDLGTIPAGGQATISVLADMPSDVVANTVENTATTTSATPDGTPLDNTPIASNAVSPSADLSIVKAAPTSTIIAGSPVTYTLTVSNAGSSDATDLVITDTLPASFDPATVSEVSVDADCTITGLAIRCTQASLADGATSVVEITATVLSDVVDATISNTAEVSAATADADPGNNTSTFVADNVPEADLSITKATVVPAAGDAVDPGAPVEYALTVTNAGPADAVNVVIADALPADITFGAISTADAGTCDQVAVTCTFASIADGESVTVTVTGTLSDRALDEIVNTATVAADTNDPDPASNSVDLTTVVTPFADLSVAKSLVTGPLVAGTQHRYALVVVNDGPAAATAVTLTDTLPTGLSFVSVSTPIGECSHDGSAVGGVVACDLGRLPDQASLTVTIDVDVLADTTGNVVNTASVSSPVEQPVGGGNPNSSTSTEPVPVRADLQLTKSLVEDQLTAGLPFTYTLDVKNNGPSDSLSPIVVTDDLPAIVDQTLPITATPAADCVVTTNPGGQANVTCTLTDRLAVGASTTVTIEGTMLAGAVTDSVANLAVVTSADDVDTADNESTSTDQAATDADLVLTKTFASPSVRAGETTDFTLAVTNNGPSDAQRVQLDDVLPAGFSIAADTDITAPVGATCVRSTTNAANDTISCDLGTVADEASASVTITATVDPDQPGGPVTNTATVASQESAVGAGDATTDRNPGSNTATDGIIVERLAALTAAKVITSPAQVPTPIDVVAGERITYEITVGNDGPSSAEGTVVGDQLPANVTIDVATITPSAPTCSAPGGLLVCNLGVLQPGDRRTVTYEVVVGAEVDAGTAITNRATANSPTPLDGGPPTSEATINVDTVADLEVVSKVASPTTAIAGEPLEYTINVRNNGPSDAIAVQVVDTIPAGLTVIEASLPSGCTVDGAGDLTCVLGDLSAGETVSIVFSADVAPDVVDPIINTAVASSTTPEPVGGGAANSGSVTTAVSAVADLSLAKAALPNPAIPGRPITYTLVVTNNGPSVSRDVTVADTDVVALLEGATGSWVNGASTGTCDATVSCDIGDLPLGEATITIVGTVPSDRVEALVNTAAASSPTSEGADALPSTATATTPVAPAADLRISKTGPVTDVVAGGAVEWTIVVTNDGPSDAFGVTIGDDLPTALDAATITVDDGGSTCTIDGFALSCVLDTLPAAGSVTITVGGTLSADFADPELDNVATVASGTFDPATGNNTATASNDNVPSADVGVTGTATADPVAAGTSATVEFDIVNNGPSTAIGTVVTIPLPPGLAVLGTPTLTGAPAGAIVTVVDGNVVVDLGALPPGVPVNLSFVTAIDPAQAAGALPLTATVATTTPQSATANDAATVSLDIVNVVDLSVVKEASVARVDFGDEITFTITVSNAGPSASVGATITDALPASLEAVSVTDADRVCAIAGQEVTCLNPTIGPGESYPVTIVARAIGNGPQENTVVVDCGCDDEAILGSTAPFDIVRVSDLAVTKTADRSIARVGDAIVYTITVSNTGPDPAVGVIVTEQLPAALTYVSSSATQGAFDPASGLWSVGTVEVGQSFVLTLTARTAAVANTANTATVGSAVSDTNTENNVASVTVFVDGGQIPATGRDSLRLLPLGLGLVGFGLALLFLRRRRSTAVPV